MDGSARKRDVPHLVVFLPGIGGSELTTAQGAVVWGLSMVRRPWKPIRLPGLLVPRCAPLDDPEYDDGLVPGRILAAPLPGITRFFGTYRKLRALLPGRFDLRQGLNYLEFAYDWRRPIEVASARLSETLPPMLNELDRVRPGAKIILIAHSMGGLVARHYLQHHDPGGDVVRLVTLGTPFRGAPKALGALVNGPTVRSVNVRPLAPVLRRLPSVYQLLPVYPSVVVGGETRYVEDCASALDLDADRVGQARKALLELAGDLTSVVPVAGFGAPTPQQAHWDGRELVLEDAWDRLPGSDGTGGGDGTVPVVSARAPGLKNGAATYLDETHQSIVNSRPVLDALRYRLNETLDWLEYGDPYRGLGDQGPVDQDRKALDVPPPAVELDLADAYPAPEKVVLHGTHRDGPLIAGLDGTDRVWPVEPDASGAFTLDLGRLSPGLHRLTLSRVPDRFVRYTDVVEVL